METVVTLTEKRDVLSKKNGSTSSDIKLYKVEAVVDEEQLETIKGYPMYFTYYEVQGT
jgi:hypothetical protein